MARKFALASLGHALISLAFVVHAGQPTCNSDCLRDRAMNGDGKAALQLANDSLHKSHEAMIFWYRIAAENGDVTGQFNYGVFLVSDSKRKAECVRALFWFRKAAKQGEELALQYIGPLEKKLKGHALDHGCVDII